MDLSPRLALSGALVCAAVAFGMACGDGYNSGGDGETATQPSASATQPLETSEPTTASTATGPAEQGEAPIFWRTADDFASLRAGEAYKVLFRVTSDYAGDAVSVTARCLTCPNSADRQPLTFEANRAEAGEGEAPGAYYPFNLDLPFAGTWEVAVAAGADHATLTVEVQSGGGASG